MKLNNLRSKILSQATVWERRFGHIFFRVISRLVVREKPDGNFGTPFNYFLFDRGNSVSALIHLTDTDEVVLVRQYRAGSDSFLIELPAGMIDGDENPADAVIREVMEETGFDFERITHLKKVFLSPGGYTESSSIFYVETQMNFKKGDGGGKFEESEEIEVFVVAAGEAIEMMNDGIITDAKTIIALQWLDNKTKK